jgi:BioD-like phosphotransacetylase family protein
MWMKLSEVQIVLDAEVVSGIKWMDREVMTVCAADLMSDVLAFAKESTLLVTGLTNLQVVRTAEMSDVVGIVFVRGKYPGPELIELARRKDIPLFIVKHSLYETSGRLYQHDLKSCHKMGEIL